MSRKRDDNDNRQVGTSLVLPGLKRLPTYVLSQGRKDYVTQIVPSERQQTRTTSPLKDATIGNSVDSGSRSFKN